MSTFVSVGNATQPFPRFLNAIADICKELPQPVFVQYGSTYEFSCEACMLQDFVTMEEFENRMVSSSLLIMHAGAGSVIHALRAGKLPVVIPRLSAYGEHVDDHQLEFSRELAGLGKIILCEKPEELTLAITKALAFGQTVHADYRDSELIRKIRSLLHT
jgi:UDP-N-acetylglucosamine transferase subunit ALG13